MSLRTAVQMAHFLACERLESGAVVVDATAGNGKDTVWLAQQVGKNGCVYAFDIQEDAIRQTASRLEESGLQDRVELIQDSHHLAHQYIKHDQLDLALFNLGYLPGGNKSVVTQPDTTREACEQLMNLLRTGGLLILVLYPGHLEGRIEAQALEHWAQSLDQTLYTVQKVAMFNQKNNPPYVLAIEKRGSSKN